MTAVPETFGPVPVTSDERRQIMDSAVSDKVRHGWRVESRSEFQAVFAKGHRHSHGLHLFLTIITLGLWGLFVWLPLSVFGGEKRKIVTVDEYGQTRGR